MKVLYAIQGTGNGHVCRAREIVPLLKKHADVDVLISGIQSDVRLPFDVTYVFGGLSYIFGKKGGIDLLETYKKSHIKKLMQEIRQLPVELYDLIISDFEPVSAWACYLKNKPCVGLSHQAGVLNKHAPRPRRKDPVGKTIMKVYAPASVQYGFHFGEYDEHVFTPVIRKQVREAVISDKGHYTVYLPSYSDKKIIRLLQQCKDTRWQVFSKHFSQETHVANIQVFPLDNDKFIESMASSHGVLCGAGFETPAESLFLGKKLMVIPMKNQYEQHCNAAALAEMGVPVMKSLKQKHLPILQQWIADDQAVEVFYPDETELILEKILTSHAVTNTEVAANYLEEYDVKEFKRLTLRRIISKLT